MIWVTLIKAFVECLIIHFNEMTVSLTYTIGGISADTFRQTPAVSTEDWEEYSSKKILTPNKCLSAHAIAQPCRHTKNEVFQALKGLCDVYAT